jgi:hypothetical protein
MRFLILDDDASRHEGFDFLLPGHKVVHAYSYTDFVAAAKSQTFDIICLDHDLGIEVDGEQMIDNGQARELTGQDAARWLVDNPQHFPDSILVHSHNPVGAAAIADILRAVPGKRVVVRPYSAPRK